MRQSQQKNRMRGRGRKGPNPLSRTFESNGPDVKIRGTAAHIAEKYASLARDALSAGDNVMGENYLQHAEHYNRIIAAAAAAQPNRPDESSSGYGRGPQPDINGYGGPDGDGDETDSEPRAEHARQDPAEQAQPGADQQARTNGEAGENRPRGEQRNRRRQRQASQPGANGNGDAAEHEGDSANGGRPARRERGEISSDASMLPESLVGKGADPVAESGAED